MPGEVAQLLDGISVKLANGTVYLCKPPSVRHARVLIKAYRSVVRPPPPPAPPGADDATKAAAVKAADVDEAEHEDALALILDLFPTAVGMPDAALDGLAPGDILRFLPPFFWKTTGATLVPAGDNGMSASPTGMPSGASSSPPASP